MPYVAIARQPQAWVSETDYPQDRPTCTVFIEDAEPVRTGLVTAEGVDIWRVPETKRIGFMTRPKG